MRYRENKNIISFFDVSIILPFYKRLNDFRKVLPKNAHYFQRNGIEVVIVLDEPSEEKELIEFINNYPFINFKIIINRVSHQWRNPSKVINVGIKHSSFNYILVMSPETELLTDMIYQLRYALYHYPLSYATGVVCFLSYGDDVSKFQNVHWMPYGSIMVNKTDLIKVKGYDENHDNWGGEDDQIRRKLDLIGLRKIELLDAKSIHRELKSDGHKERTSRTKSMPTRHLKNIFYPKKASLNINWGKDFDEVIWYWKTDKNYLQLKKYLSQFQKWHLTNQNNFQNNFQIIVLIQMRNELKHIPEILSHLNDYCDGIILLDDGSEDSTYENAVDNKLLVKAKKVYKGYFDDLENRNQLLRIASFFKSEWFIFIDADERIDIRFSNIKKYSNKKDFDVYKFYLVDLWDNLNTYRTDIKDRNNLGITLRKRMFRNKGNLQIISNREIHFPAVPYNTKIGIAKILLLHFGVFDKTTRKRKFDLYSSQDYHGKKLGYSYDYLIDKDPVLKKIENIESKDLPEV